MADIEAHFHGGPLESETRTLDAGQGTFVVLDDVTGQRGEYLHTFRMSCSSGPAGSCYDWTGGRSY